MSDLRVVRFLKTLGKLLSGKAPSRAVSLNLLSLEERLTPASINVFKVYNVSTPTNLSEPSSIALTTLLSSTNVTFTSANPLDPLYSGNNVPGTIGYDAGPTQVSGVASRLVKVGSAVKGVYVYDGTTSQSYLIELVNNYFNPSTSYSTSSDPVDGALNKFLPPGGITTQVTVASIVDDVAPIIGTVATGGVTNDADPLVSGTLSTTLATGEVLKIYQNGTYVGDAVVTNTAWTFAPTTLPDGTYSYAARVESTTLQGAFSNGYEITVDTTAPSAPSFISVTDDTNIPTDRITSDRTLTVTGTAEVGSTVKLYDYTNPSFPVFLGSAVVAADGTYSVISTSLADGVYPLQITATDDAGNESAPTDLNSWTIDGTAPSAPNFSSVSDDTNILGDRITSDRTLTVTGTAGSAEPGSTVKLYDYTDPTLPIFLGSAVVNGDGSYAVTTTSLVDGVYPLKITATDVAGNESGARSLGTWTIDGTAPSAPAYTTVSDDTNIVGDLITSDRTLTVVGAPGSAEPGSTVKLYDYTVPAAPLFLGSAVVAANGSYSVTTTSLLDGVYPLRITATDLAGNESSPTDLGTWTIDGTAPSAPNFSAVSDDTNIVGDRITSDRTLTVTGSAGSAEAGSTVKLYDYTNSASPVFLGSAVVNGDGSYSVTTSSLADGVYPLRITATDLAGNESGPTNLGTWTIDGTAPSAPNFSAVSDDTNIVGDRITSDRTLTVTGSAGSAEAGSTVKLYDYSIPASPLFLGSAVVNGDGSYSVTTSSLADGVYPLRITATDVAGNESGPTNLGTWTIDGTAPSAPNFSAVSDDTNIIGDRITSDRTLTVTGTAGSAEPGTTVKLYDYTNSGSPVFLGSAVVAADGSYSVTTSSLADGVYPLRITATDVAGNESSPTDLGTWTIDGTAPSAPNFSSVSDDTNILGDLITSDRTLTVTGSAGSAEAGSTVKLYDYTNPALPVFLGSALVNGDGSYSVITSSLADGVYPLRITATDLAGNESSPTNLGTWTIDGTAPSAPNFSAVSDDTNIVGDRITNDRTLTVTGTPGSAEAGSTVKLYDYTTPASPLFLGSAVVNVDGSYSVTTSSLADGVYPLRITATDVAGNESGPTNLGTWTIDGTAPSAPNFSAVSDDTNIIGDRITSDRTLTVTGTAGSAEPGTTVKLYDYTNPALPVFLGSAVVAADGSYSVTTSSLADGVYPLRITATDVAGNESSPTDLGIWTIDTTAPSAPNFSSVTDDTNIVGDRNTSDRTLTVTGSVGSAEPGSTVKLYDYTDPILPVFLGSAVVNGDGSYSVITSSLADGVYPLKITATDLAGNESGARSLGTWTIDGTAPSAPGYTTVSDDTNIAGDRITNDRTLTVVGAPGSAEPGSIVKLYDYTNPASPQLLGSAVVAPNGSYTVTSISLPDGVYPLKITATDLAGNESATTDLGTWTIDGTAPSAPNFSAVSDDTNIVGDQVTSDRTLTVTGTAGSAEPGSTVKLYDYTNPALPVFLGSALVAADGSYSVTTSSLADGVYPLRITATDVAGNESSPTNLGTWTIDTTAPSAPNFSSVSDDTNIVGDRITSDRTLTVTGTPGSAEPGSTVKVYDYTDPILPVLLGSAVVNPDGSYSVTTSSLPDGVYPLKITATDVAGNESGARSLGTWTIDSTAPVAPGFSTVSDDTNIPTDKVTSDRTLTVTGVPGSAEPRSTVKLYDYTNPASPVFLGSAVVNPDGSYSVTTSTLVDGTYPLMITSTDVAGNESSPTDLGIWTIDGTAPSAPQTVSVGVDTANPSDQITSDNTLTVTGIAEPFSLVTIYDNGVAVGTGYADANGNFSVTTSVLADGQHPLTMTATDLAGNESLPTDLGIWTIDTAAPLAPSITSIGDDTGTPGDGITTDTTPTVDGLAEPGSVVSVYVDGNLIGTVVADPTTGAWTYVLPAQTLGNHAITATATDTAGNTGPACAPSNITIVPPFTSPAGLQSVTLRTGTTGSLQLRTVNGTGPITYAVVSGSLPAGLRLNPNTGAIGGVPTTVGNRSVRVRATDVHGHTVDIGVSIRVVAAFKPYLVSAGIGAINNVGKLPSQMLNATSYANGTSVTLYDGIDTTARAQYVPFIGYKGEVRVAFDDVNRDGRVDILAVPGPGASPVIKMLDVQSGATLRTFQPFSPFYRGGVFLTTGDVNNDGVRDVIASTGGGIQPRIVALDGSTGARLLDFTPFSRVFQAGVTVAVTDTDRNGINEIIVGSGVGDLAMVRIFDSVTRRLIRQFTPFGADSRVGVNVAAGDIGGDGLNEIVAATMSRESRVVVWDAQTLRQRDAFFAYGQNDGVTAFPGGVRVAVEDLDRNGEAELITGAGPLGFPHVRVWRLVNGKFRDVASFFVAAPSDNRGVNLG